MGIIVIPIVKNRVTDRAWKVVAEIHIQRIRGAGGQVNRRRVVVSVYRRFARVIAPIGGDRIPIEHTIAISDGDHVKLIENKSRKEIGTAGIRDCCGDGRLARIEFAVLVGVKMQRQSHAYCAGLACIIFVVVEIKPDEISNGTQPRFEITKISQYVYLIGNKAYHTCRILLTLGPNRQRIALQRLPSGKVACRYLNLMITGTKTGEHVPAGRIGGRGCPGWRSASIKQFHENAAYPRFAHVLKAVFTGVRPDIIADCSAGGGIPKIGRAVVLAVVEIDVIRDGIRCSITLDAIRTTGIVLIRSMIITYGGNKRADKARGKRARVHLDEVVHVAEHLEEVLAIGVGDLTFDDALIARVNEVNRNPLQPRFTTILYLITVDIQPDTIADGILR